METIREELAQHETGKIESIKPKIVELGECKIEFAEFYNRLKSKLGENDS